MSGNLGPNLRQTRTLGRVKPAYEYPTLLIIIEYGFKHSKHGNI
jgi:hypothetical protein